MVDNKVSFKIALFDSPIWPNKQLKNEEFISMDGMSSIFFHLRKYKDSFFIFWMLAAAIKI